MSSITERVYFLDAMRAVLMCLGIVLHAANVFSPSQDWLIYSDNTSQMAFHLGNIIHSFRMPAFFEVSGYFCLLTLNKYSANEFLAKRAKRIIAATQHGNNSKHTANMGAMDYWMAARQPA